jgi:hypothetical protein
VVCPRSESPDANGKPEEASEFELNHICKDKSKLKVLRSRLSDISWWMRLLSQNIAQRANKEDQEVGKFWQARYRAVRLLDETAILACTAYVDLNPIRAAMAESIEGSDFTSAQKRCCDLQVKHGGEKPLVRTSGTRSVLEGRGNNESEDGASRVGDTGHICGRHLAPVELHGGSSTIGPCVNKQGTRCSNKGFLPMSTADYLSLLDWTGRQFRTDMRGAIPATCAPILDRLDCSEETWFDLVRNFRKRFRNEAGSVLSVRAFRSKRRERRARAASV